jgi:hypothetical protein
MIGIGATVAIVALLIFIYFNRYIQRKRDDRRKHWRERREEQLQQFFEAKKKLSSEQNAEGSDTTEG